MIELPKNEYRISITSACNMKCIYCHNEGNTKISSLSLDDIELLVSNTLDLGLKQVRLTGGEPLIHKNIIDICKMLKEKYNLKVGVNTNAIEIEKLLYLISNNWIDRVVVGMDYYDGKISKQSPIGKSSKEILSNILEIKKTNCDVNISTVYNNDYDNIYKLANWAIMNDIRLKIIEIVRNELCDSSDNNYVEMRKRLIKEFGLDTKLDPLYKEVQGISNGKNKLTFFHSHCRLRECDLCKQMHLRVTSTGKLKTCIHYDDEDIDFREGNVHEKVEKVLKKKVNFYRDWED